MTTLPSKILTGAAHAPPSAPRFQKRYLLVLPLKRRLLSIKQKYDFLKHILFLSKMKTLLQKKKTRLFKKGSTLILQRILVLCKKEDSLRKTILFYVTHESQAKCTTPPSGIMVAQKTKAYYFILKKGKTQFCQKEVCFHSRIYRSFCLLESASSFDNVYFL